MDRVVIVTKHTRLEELVRKHLNEGTARFVLESQGQSIVPYEEEDAAYRAALSEIQANVPSDLPMTWVERDDLPNFLFRDKDLVVACGPDGLFANLAKYLGDQPVLTVNPDPRTVAGVLMLFPPSAVGDMIAKAQEGKYLIERLPFVKAAFSDGRVLWGINDIFIGRKDHVSARYELSFASQREHHSSSGILVSTGVGSTGWMRSVATMLEGLTRESAPTKLSRLPDATSNELVFVVREPFPSPSTGTRLVTGRVAPGMPLSVTSEMPTGGFIFSDGIVEKAVEWNAGTTVTITVGDRYVQRITR